jgi:peptidyl-prolyl cis-trans isomerase SurA
MQMRESILNGESFDQLASSFSDDPDVLINSDNLGYFTAFQTEYHMETAVFNMNPGELSMPIRTSLGYYIIQCHDKRLIDNQIIPSYDQIKEEIIERIKDAKDIRIIKIRNAFTEELKKEWNFIENRSVLESLYPIADERIFTGDWKIPDGLNPEQVLFTIDGKDRILNAFVDFISGYETNSGKYSVKEYINLLYDQFVASRLINYEYYKLEEKYPEFRYQLWEYRDAMLLLEITKRQVWLKSTSDSSGLADFFMQNKDKYIWGERLVAGIYSTTDKQTAVNATKTALKSLRGKRRDNNWAVHFTSVSNDHLLTEQLDTFSRGDNPLIDQINWKKGVTGVNEYGDKYQFVVIYDLLKPSFKTFPEAQDMVLVDYQSYLMHNWIEDLRSKYQIKINPEVLLSIKDILSKQSLK